MRIINGHAVALQAHRGVASDCPENTMAAFRAAVKQGYDIIELDPKFTRDNQCVVLHDHFINRTGRTPDGHTPEAPMNIADLSLAQAREYEYGSWFGPVFAGEPLPLLEEVLCFAKEHRIPLKLDNVIESFTDEQKRILFDLVEKTDTLPLAGFTCKTTEFLAAVVKRFPTCTIHYDGPVDGATLQTIAGLIQENPLVVWLPYSAPGTSWVTVPLADERLAQLVHGIGAKLGLWILEKESELADACERFHLDYIETPGQLKPRP